MFATMRQLRIFLLFLLKGLSCHVTTGSTKYDAEVTVTTPPIIHQIRNTKCTDYLEVMIQFNGLTAPLELRHNSDLSVHMAPVFLLTNKNEVSVANLQKESSEHPCLYQDARTNAAVLVKNINSDSRVLVEGHFSYDGVGYNINPISGDVSTHEVRVVQLDLNIKERAFTRLKRAEKKHYIVELLLFIDYSIYQRWFAKSEGGTQEAKSQQALENIKYYFSNVVNDADLRFRNIDSPDYDIKISLSGFVIATTSAAASWIEKYREPAVGRDRVDVDKAMTDFTGWVNQQHIGQLPNFDAAILFTGLDIYKVNQDNSPKEFAQVGQASVGSICQFSRTAIVEDEGNFASAFTSAHEIGHILGAKHDEKNNECRISDNYIMMPISGNLSMANHTNVYYFSPCSITEMGDVVSQQRSQCLLNLISKYNQTAYSIYINDQPGQKYDVNKQCEHHFGDGAYYCGGQAFIGNVCQNIFCHDPKKGKCYELLGRSGYMGTTCGNKKWCFQGRCVQDERAPTTGENCAAGDSKTLFMGGTKTCSELISELPGRCYEDYYRQMCCDSCSKFYTPSKTGCEYGDRADWCSSINTNDCYLNDKPCCSFCGKRRKSNAPGCEYGDKVDGCTLRLCEVFASNIPLCCSTCSSLFIPPTTTTSTSVVTTRTMTPTTTTKSTTSSIQNAETDNQNVEVIEPGVDTDLEPDPVFIPDNERTVTEKNPSNGAEKHHTITSIYFLFAVAFIASVVFS